MPDCGSLFETGIDELQPLDGRRLTVIKVCPVVVDNVISKQSAHANEMPALLSQSCGLRPVLAPQPFPVFELVTSATAFALTQPSTQLRLVLFGLLLLLGPGDGLPLVLSSAHPPELVQLCKLVAVESLLLQYSVQLSSELVLLLRLLRLRLHLEPRHLAEGAHGLHHVQGLLAASLLFGLCSGCLLFALCHPLQLRQFSLFGGLKERRRPSLPQIMG